MANIALDAGKVVLKDGKASCTCCVVCPSIESEYDVISEAIYNALQAGGNFVTNGALNEYDYCSLSKCTSGVAPSGGCNFRFAISNDTGCESGSDFRYAYIIFDFSISKVNNEYRLTYYGYAWCPGTPYGPFCYSVGWYIGWGYDNLNPDPFVNLGSITINTSAGTLGPYGIYSFPGVGSGFLNVTITPFAP